MKYLLSIFNSFIFNKFLLSQANQTGGKGVNFLEKIRIPLEESQKPFEELVDKILAKKEIGEDTTTEEREIDLMVYKLYELTDDEIKIIENC